MSAPLRPSVRLLLAVMLATAVVAAFLVHDRLDLAALENAVPHLGALGLVCYALLFAAEAVLFLPGAANGIRPAM